MSATPQADRWQRIEAILDEVIEHPAHEWPARLDAACGDDRELRAEVEALLAADQAADGYRFLTSPAAAPPADSTQDISPRRPQADGTALRSVGPYELLRVIGEGGMGTVYEARDTRLGRSVAVKVLSFEIGRTQGAKERFLREARAASALDHPNICTVHDLGETPEGELYLVMAFYDGETLGDRLARGPLPVEEARTVAIEVARALARAHAAGILHRDIKPANIMLPREGGAKVLDFGIARIAGEIGLTRTGGAPGTPAYMSPEQAWGRPVDARTDLWSLGATLYEMLAGRRPFPGDDPHAVIHGLLNRDPEPLSRLRPETPAPLARAVERLLAKEPAQRPASATELLAELGADPVGTTQPEPAYTSATGIWARPAPLMRVLVATELPGSGPWLAGLGEERAFTFASRHDRAARDLLARFGGVEVDKGEGFLLLFERAADAVGFALAYHQAVARLGQQEGQELNARVGIHLGEVLLRKNPEADVTRGAKPLEIEGLAKPTVGRVMALAAARQTLLTRAAFDLARRAALEGELADSELSWLAHGSYALAGFEEPLEIFEVGVEGFAPLAEPASTGSAKRVVAIGDELALGWRPAAGQPIPRRSNWLLRERIGEGGFGEVWLARHKSGEQRVFKFCFEAARLRALKREVTLFRLLRDALGHRHDVARILDWSFEQPPYFLESEYADGGNLLEWSAAQGGLDQVPLAARLELAAEVAEALAAAHSVGILHKDVKPENVLIALDRDGRPHSQLTDFGIGLFDPGATAPGLGSFVPSFTVLGFTATSSADETAGGGTVRYMAPELLEGKPASIQADIYSLGVLIYQLVAGDFSRALAPGWQRDVADELLAEDLAGFVDGRPERRPASALEVARSLRTLDERRAAREAERRAREEAEQARAALERQVRRRRLATGVAAAAVVVLAVVGLLAVRERRARETAMLRQQQAENLIGFMLGDLRDKLELVGRLEILDGVGAKAMEYFAAVPLAELSDDELARRSQALYQIGDVRIRRGKLLEAIPPIEESLALAKELADRDPMKSQRQFELAQSHFWLGSACLEEGDLARAREQFVSYFEIALRSAEQDPDDRTWQMELAYAYTNLAAVAEASGDLEQAVQQARGSLEIKQRLVTAQPGDSKLESSLAGGCSWLARILAKKGDLRGALAEYERERALREALLARHPEDTAAQSFLATSLSHIADLRWQLGDEEAALTDLGRMQEHLGRLVGHDPSNGSWRRDLAVSHRQLGEVRLARGELAAAAGELATAGRLLRVLAASSSASLDWQRDAAWLDLDLASLALARRDLTAARRAAGASIAACQAILSKRPEDDRTRNLLARAHLLAGRIEAEAGAEQPARFAWERALDTIEATARGSDNPLLLDSWAEALRLLGREDEGRALRRRLAASGFVQPAFVNRSTQEG